MKGKRCFRIVRQLKFSSMSFICQIIFLLCGRIAPLRFEWMLNKRFTQWKMKWVRASVWEWAFQAKNESDQNRIASELWTVNGGNSLNIQIEHQSSILPSPRNHSLSTRAPALFPTENEPNGQQERCTETIIKDSVQFTGHTKRVMSFKFVHVNINCFRFDGAKIFIGKMPRDAEQSRKRTLDVFEMSIWSFGLSCCRRHRRLAHLRPGEGRKWR